MSERQSVYVLYHANGGTEGVFASLEGAMVHAMEHLEGNPSPDQWSHYIAAQDNDQRVWYIKNQFGLSIVEHEVRP